MTTKVISYANAVRVRRVFVIGLLIVLGISVTTGFVRLQTDHMIAPPALRVMEVY